MNNNEQYDDIMWHSLAINQSELFIYSSHKVCFNENIDLNLFNDVN